MGFQKNTLGRGRRLVLTVLGLGASILPLSGCASSSHGAGAGSFTDSPYSNVDIANTRDAASSLRSDTVSDLAQAWALPINAHGDGLGAYTATPVVLDGVLYSQDQDSNVQAIDIRSGAVLWEKRYELPTEGPNGVVVVDGRVYGATPTGAFALDEKSGEEVWTTALVRNGSEQVTMAPGYHDGLVYLSTSPADLKGGEIGILWALDGKTGTKVWSFDTVPKGLWGNPQLNFGGGLSYAPAFDAKGSMYVGTGSAGPIPGTASFPWGSSRPGPNLYTDSVVKLDAKTGKVRWHYQLTPHGLCKWDLGAPVLRDAAGRHLAIAAGRSGIVIALDRETGKLVWRQPVGIHNGHDDDGLIAMRGEYPRLRTPMSVFPGRFGGVYAPISANSSSLFIPVINYATRLSSQSSASEPGAATGELVALDVATGRVKWKHRFPSSLSGATTATNDLLFATTFDGTVHAFDAESGQELWRETLSASINAGVVISGGTLLVPAGYVEQEGQIPELVAYRLSN